MSYGVRSLLAFWVGGAAIPSGTTAVATTPFTGNAGLFLPPKSKFVSFPRARRKFAKWKPRARER